MRVVSLSIAAAVVALAACVPGQSRKAELQYPESTVEMTLKKVSDHVYYAQGAAGVATDNQGFISNSAVVVTDDGVILFDALGTPSLAEKLLTKIRAVTDKPIKKVFVSHYHADHIYGLQVFKDLGAEIYGPAGARDYLVSDIGRNRLQERRESLWPWVNEQTRLVAPDHLVSEDMQFRFGGLDFTVVSFGSAHSQGDLSLFVEQDKALLSGDLVFTGRIPFVSGNDVGNWIAGLESLLDMGAAIVVPGHGGAFADSAEGTRLTLDYLQYLKEKMAAAVDDLVQFDEAYQAVDWSAFDDLPAFGPANRRNAYRVYLAAEAAALAN